MLQCHKGLLWIWSAFDKPIQIVVKYPSYPHELRKTLKDTYCHRPAHWQHEGRTTSLQSPLRPMQLGLLLLLLLPGHNKTPFLCPWGRVALSFGRVAQGDRTNASCGPFPQWSWWTERIAKVARCVSKFFFKYRSRQVVVSSEVDGFNFVFTSASCSQKSGIGLGSAGRNCSAAAEEGVD